MIAPMPSPVSDHGPSVLRRRCSGWSASEISLSMDLQHRSWLPLDCVAGSVVVDNGPKSPRLWRRAKAPAPHGFLSLRLSAGQLLDFRFLRSASVVAGL